MVNIQKICRRENHRFSYPVLDVRLDGAAGTSKDWSLGGIAVQVPELDNLGLGPDRLVSGDIAYVDGPEHHAFSGRVVRLEAHRNLLAIEFSEISEGAVMMFVRSFRHMVKGAA